MIQEITIRGSKYTTLHNIQMSVEGNRITISPGQVWQNSEIVLDIKESIIIDIPVNEEECYYEINLTSDKVIVNTKTNNQSLITAEYIIKLCWFTVPKNIISLDDVQVHFVKVVEEHNED